MDILHYKLHLMKKGEIMREEKETSRKMRKTTRNKKKKKEKKIPSSRIRTSDLWITISPLQSTALPTELSKDTCLQIYKLSFYWFT